MKNSNKRIYNKNERLNERCNECMRRLLNLKKEQEKIINNFKTKQSKER